MSSNTIAAGDPETEVIMPRIQSDPLHLFENMGAGLLSEYHLQIDPRTCSTVMLVSDGYPETTPRASPSICLNGWMPMPCCSMQERPRHAAMWLPMEVSFSLFRSRC